MARQAAVEIKFGLVQVIRLQWSKAARGGEGARARSAVPLAFEVPAAELADANDVLCLDTLDWGSRNAFAEPYSVRRQRVPLADDYKVGCVTVSPDADGLLVRYRYDRANGGAPDRWFFNWSTNTGDTPSRSASVRSGEWVRVRHNGRFSCRDNGNWWYEQVTVNVAWFTGKPDGRVFVVREPTQEILMLAELR